MAAGDTGGVTDQSPEEMAAHFEGPVAAAYTFLDLLKGGRLEETWPLADEEWRLGRVQAWLWNNRTHPLFDDYDLDAEAAAGVDGGRDRWWWPSFVEIEVRRWAAALESFDPDRWGAASRPRPIAIDYELVLFVETGGEVLLITQPTVVPVALTVLLHVVDARWLVAAIDSPRYRPGWPPTFADGTPAV